MLNCECCLSASLTVLTQPCFCLFKHHQLCVRCRLSRVLVTEVDILANKFSQCLNKIGVCSVQDYVCSKKSLYLYTPPRCSEISPILPLNLGCFEIIKKKTADTMKVMEVCMLIGSCFILISSHGYDVSVCLQGTNLVI